MPGVQAKIQGGTEFFLPVRPNSKVLEFAFRGQYHSGMPGSEDMAQSNSFPSRIELRRTGNPGGNLSAVTKFFPDGTVNSQTN